MLESEERPVAVELLPARELDLRRALRLGLVFGAAVAFVAAVGMVEAFHARILVAPLMSASDAVLLLLGLGSGLLAGQPPPVLESYAAPRRGPRSVLAGLIAGSLTGAVLSVFVLIFTAVNLRGIFVAITPGLMDLLTFGRGTGVGILLILVAGGLLGAVGGALQVLDHRPRRAVLAAVAWVLGMGLLQILVSQILTGLRLEGVAGLLYRSAGGLEPGSAAVVALVVLGLSLMLEGRTRRLRRAVDHLPKRQRQLVTAVALLVVFAALSALPQILGNFLSAVLSLAGTFLLMALGLNIVVGFAGLLDLGYVAFFAVGAYMTAVLTSPSSPAFSPELIFWAAIPFIMMAGALAGLMVGTPVLRMRGDYLAIVTLGFGEIARLIAQSDWQKATLGGAQGIARIPSISIGPIEFVRSQDFFYLIFAFVIVFTYITYALQASRVGRAWNAMREDETVAEAMGVNIVAAKLWAFVLGAIMASLGGALFAHKLTTVFPHSFNIIVSITVLVIVIVGGMGSVPGVVVGALVLVGLPELLREFEEFKFLLYGTVLIFMMLKRPEGFIPSRRRARELREEERAQDAWLRAQAEAQLAEQAE